MNVKTRPLKFPALVGLNVWLAGFAMAARARAYQGSIGFQPV